MGDEVIELSVQETNKLRASLGLAPLRMDGAAAAPPNNNFHNSNPPPVPTNAAESGDNGDVVLELSVDATNNLRESLGLSRLNQTPASPSASSSRNIVHYDAGAETATKEAKERLEQARLKRQVDQGIAQFTRQSVLSDTQGGPDDISSWARAMKNKTTTNTHSATTKASKEPKPNSSSNYEEKDLAGMNVAHSAAELQEGSTTVLTLADDFILETDDTNKVLGLNEDKEQLENVDLVDQRNVSEGLKAKRKMELGMGRAGGYAGFDDDEFEELGGATGPTRLARGAEGGDTKNKKKTRGFQIGSMLEEQEVDMEMNFFVQHQAGISLETKGDIAASDFMTVEEEEAERANKKSKKELKFKKQKKKKDKKGKRRTESDDEPEDEPRGVGSKDLLTELEDTAVEVPSLTRKRQRSDSQEAESSSALAASGAGEIQGQARAKFDAVVAKANERAKAAFAVKAKPAIVDYADEEPDDAFLNAALAKARRLNRLKEMQTSGSSMQPRGADAIVAALHSSNDSSLETGSSGAIVFSIDETHEFSRALRARAEQSVRKEAKTRTDDNNAGASSKEALSKHKVSTVTDETEEMGMAELAKEMPVDIVEAVHDDEADGTNVSLGRGLGSVLGLLKQTGDLSRRSAGREDMRGRAKDKKTYEDYEPLDLAQVVKIGDKATEQDKDLASREIKLEYRDKYGRLLTRKEAFRELCYQFHGHGSGKRKEEKRSTQISREQAESRVASRQTTEGTFAALKATQKATGKAFVVHKT
jgi:U4/U6.U5 tri-snRNP-associated protein 1